MNLKIRVALIVLMVISVAVWTTLHQRSRPGVPQKPDLLAAQIIADPGSHGTQLMAAMMHFYWYTPEAVADSAAQHLDDDLAINRAMAYQLVINAGGGDQVRARLIDEVMSLEYAQGENKQMLLALAAIEPPETFLPRLEQMRLRPSVKNVAMLSSRFLWSNDSIRLAMLPDMLGTDDGELDLLAIGYLLRNGRVDLLREYRLIWVEKGPLAMHAEIVPGFDTMSREQRLQYLQPDELDRIERAEAMPRGVKAVVPVERFGYRLEQRDGQIVIIPPR
ncbi:MAG: hypothetical protein WBN65_13670 [Gammaproteobacteria bacterium]